MTNLETTVAEEIVREYSYNPDQKDYFYQMIEGANIYLAGNAGTGKSHLIRGFIAFCERTKKKLLKSASTGIAAVNIGGVTIHSLFGLSANDLQTVNLVKPVKSIPSKVKKVLEIAQILLVDEISMVRIDLFDKIMSYILIENQERERKGRKPVQLIFVGDFFQLPPVIDSKKTMDDKVLKEAYGRDVGAGYCFQSRLWKTMNMKLCMLTEVVRQSDEQFCDALDKCKLGDKSCLNYFMQNASKYETKDAIWLYGKNASAFEKNKECLNELKTRIRCFEAEYDGSATKDDGLCEDKLWLKEGARVLMTANDPSHRFYNGSMGTVIKFGDDYIAVRIDGDNGTITVNRKSYEKREYVEEVVTETIDKPDGTQEKKSVSTLTLKVTGSVEQYPMKLGYAITIHKSQGQTYEAMNLAPEIFTIGQLYVAMSRCKTIENVFIDRPLNEAMLRTSKQVIMYYESPETYSFFPEEESVVSVLVPKKHKTIIERLEKSLVGREDEFIKLLRAFEKKRTDENVQLSLLDEAV